MLASCGSSQEGVPVADRRGGPWRRRVRRRPKRHRIRRQRPRTASSRAGGVQRSSRSGRAAGATTPTSTDLPTVCEADSGRAFRPAWPGAAQTLPRLDSDARTWGTSSKYSAKRASFRRNRSSAHRSCSMASSSRGIGRYAVADVAQDAALRLAVADRPRTPRCTGSVLLKLIDGLDCR